MIELLRATCAAEEVALVVVTHAPEVAEKFDRVEELTEINQVSAKQIA
jgi:putative ABC transport system ATP-binding protein